MRNFNHLKKKWELAGVCLFSCLCLNGLGSCSGNNLEVDPPTFHASDPNRPVTFTDYTPNEGGMRTRMFITGSNFGTDVSLIHVTIGGREAKVINSSGEMIYCVVPARADGGLVEVEIENANGEESTTYTFDKKFSYIYNTAVSTLCGIVDQDGNASITDGGFDVAGFNDPQQLSFDDSDGERNIYLFEGNQTIRKINLDTEQVSTIITTSNVNWQYANTIAWSAERDTMFTNNVDDGSEYSPGIYYFLRKENFSVGHAGATARGINVILKNPVDQGIYMVRGADASLYKTMFDKNKDTWITQNMGQFGNNAQWYQCAVFHPSGKYAYFVSREQHVIMKTYYNTTTNLLDNPTVFVGTFGSIGYQDGTGTQASFNSPRQGCFVKNEEYIKAGKEDIYDFYVTDYGNHSIRKVTPEGIVTTFAGLGSWAPDYGESGAGYIDGDPRKTARFKEPWGICYDEANATFYISDNGNKRIRTIAVQ